MSTNLRIECPHCSHVTQFSALDAVCGHCGGAVHDHTPQPNALGLCPSCFKIYMFDSAGQPVRISLEQWEGFDSDVLSTMAEMLDVAQDARRQGFLFRAVQEFYAQRGELGAAQNPILCLAFTEGYDDDRLSQHAENIAQGSTEMKELLDFLVDKTRDQVTVGDMLGLMEKVSGLNRTSDSAVYS